MDFVISGSGMISTGEYDAVQIRGSARSDGLIRCRNFSCSGSFSGTSDIECQESVHISGSFSNSGSISSETFGSAGSVSGISGLTAEKARISGSLSAKGNIRAYDLRVSGRLETDSDIECETAYICSAITSGGLINAEDFHADMSGSHSSKAAGIGGSRIVIERHRGGFFSRLLRFGQGCFKVTEAIEGDEIDIEYTTARTVCGRSVRIGKGCRIDLVQYSESADISPHAQICRTEKV